MSVRLKEFGSGVPENELKLYIVFSVLEFILSVLRGQNQLLAFAECSLVKSQLRPSVSIMLQQKDTCLTVINVMSSTSTSV